MSSTERYNTIIIGGGQAGLASGYYLKQRGDHFVILDENARIGTAWRARWDSLRLFTPSFNNHLPGMKFPKPDLYFPTKDETADYLEAYAGRFSLPIQFGVKVDHLQRNEAGYQLTAGENNYHARNVIIATGAFYTPYRPSLSQHIAQGIHQMHSVDYHNPGDIPVKTVLVVGAGNSGAEIAIELAQSGRTVWLAGRDVGRIPADKLGKFFGGRPYWWFMRHVMTVDTPLGKRMKSAVFNHGNPLIRTSREDVVKAGVELIPRLVESQDDIPHAEDGCVIAADGIVWATGFRPDYQWINLPIFDQSGQVMHTRGVVPRSLGIFFVGLHFQSGLTSALLGGVGQDAQFITSQIQ
jgi:putative flavoprotein involved in K+ transport